MSQEVPSWLRNHISHIVGSTCLSTHERHLEVCLRRMPYTEQWNGAALRECNRLSPDGSQFSLSSNVSSNGPDLDMFTNLRLTFDSDPTVTKLERQYSQII
jgi:hypothetical protein